ncbi:uncharacterized protein IWZ02DRAFT_276085 [Phyllosticta citriasiana]|uniref:uncharacterized protein n=1 Tax=Phyllosticta citriasiana TaxID=595635 RepID=UPI0030FDDEE4
MPFYFFQFYSFILAPVCLLLHRQSIHSFACCCLLCFALLCFASAIEPPSCAKPVAHMPHPARAPRPCPYGRPVGPWRSERATSLQLVLHPYLQLFVSEPGISLPSPNALPTSGPEHCSYHGLQNAITSGSAPDECILPVNVFPRPYRQKNLSLFSYRRSPSKWLIISPSVKVLVTKLTFSTALPSHWHVGNLCWWESSFDQCELAPRRFHTQSI